MKCSFCGDEIRPCGGMLVIKNDGTVYRYCSSKCKRNHRIRKPKEVAWTEEYRKRKELRKAM